MAVESPPVDPGPEGERQLDLVRAAVDLGDGFELLFVASPSAVALNEVERRLLNSRLEGAEALALRYAPPSDLDRITEDLVRIGAAVSERRLILVRALGPAEELAAGWARALVLLNEQRNRVVRDCRHVVALVGPADLPVLASGLAPDLWSVRTFVATLPDPPSRGVEQLPSTPRSERWPLAHELHDGAYYANLAASLSDGRSKSDQRMRSRLLLKAAASYRLKGDMGAAVRAAEAATAAARLAGDAGAIAEGRGAVADILQARGDLDEALRILREEALPVYERLGDVRSRAVTMGKIHQIQKARGGWWQR